MNSAPGAKRLHILTHLPFNILLQAGYITLQLCYPLYFTVEETDLVMTLVWKAAVRSALALTLPGLMA